MKILVAGIGNIFLSDDAFGVEVARRMMRLKLPDEVRVEDFGIRGIHLAYELLEGYDAAVLVDTVDLRERPGTVALIEPEADGLTGQEPSFDSHNMNPEMVLSTLAHLGGRSDRVFVIGCQPESLDEGMGLSQAVESAVDRAVEVCMQLVEDLVKPALEEEKR